MKEVLKHDYSGSCSPQYAGQQVLSSQNTFSVGIFQWLPKSSGKGLKKSAVIVRVKGYISEPEKVYQKAKDICTQLDEGTYKGKKTVSV
jgi:hypothetical protein